MYNMKTMLIGLLLLGSITLFGQETIVMRCYLHATDKLSRIEIFSSDGNYEVVQLPSSSFKDEKEAHLIILKKINSFNQKGFKVVSFGETEHTSSPFGLTSTYVLAKE